MKMQDQIIYVTMFNNFTMNYNNIILGKDQMKSKKLFKLLVYLLYYHQRFISSEELIDILWYEDEVENPIAALKNLIYRLRTLLKQQLNLYDFVITGQGGYLINRQYTIEIDAYLFEKYNLELVSRHQENELYNKFLTLYTGYFLSDIDDYHILSLNAYYHTLYLSRVIDCAKLLKQQKKYTMMEKLAQGALAIDNLNDDLYIILIESLYLQQKYHESIETYRATTDLLYKTMGVQPSSKMRDLYEIIRQESHDEGHINDIQKDLTLENKEGAFFCEYGAFKDIYNMQMRMMDRLGICAHLCLITIKTAFLYTDLESEYIKKIMQKIQNALIHKLRTGDIVSRYSFNQFIVLLPACDFKNANMVMERVLNTVITSAIQKKMIIDISIEEVGLMSLKEA